MPVDELHRSYAERATQVLRELLTGCGVAACGVVFGQAGAWNEGELRVVPRPGLPALRIAHDTQEAPYALDAPDAEDRSLLVSISDEDELCVCAWAELSDGSSLQGLGIDLASCMDFAGKRGERFNHLLFSEREQALAAEFSPGDLPLGFAYAFSAKEAGFKACAAPLRRWYDAHDEELIFGVPEFELVSPEQVGVLAKKPKTARALELIGVREICVARCALDGVALTVARS